MARKLTEHEKRVLYGVIKGKTDREIALDLGISHRTVNAELRTIYNKLDVSSRVEAAVKALTNQEVLGNTA